MHYLYQWRHAITSSDLSSTDRFMALVLSLHMNRNGGSCFPSLETLALESGLGTSTVCRALASLHKQGFITRRPGGGRSKSTQYEARIPKEKRAPRRGTRARFTSSVSPPVPQWDSLASSAGQFINGKPSHSGTVYDYCHGCDKRMEFDPDNPVYYCTECEKNERSTSPVS